MRRAPSLAVLQRQCDEFNSDFPIGQRVTVVKDSGERVFTNTRSEAQVLSGHSAVVWLDGIVGCYLLDRVEPVVSRMIA